MISLKKITIENFWQCINLSVNKKQEKFVASNAVSIAQSKVQPECIPLAIYENENMIGFLMYCIDRDDNEYWIYRMMIDEKCQSKGFGKKSLEKLIKFIQEDKTHSKIFLGVKVEDNTAINLYKSCGFDFNGQIIDGEHIMILRY